MVQRTCDPQWLEHEHGVKFTEEKSVPSSLSLVHALLLSASAFFSSVFKKIERSTVAPCFVLL